jgi:hypothetical protein
MRGVLKCGITYLPALQGDRKALSPQRRNSVGSRVLDVNATNTKSLSESMEQDVP